MKKTDDETKFIKSKKTRFAEFISKNSVYGIFAVVLIAICTIALVSLPKSGHQNTDASPTPPQISDADSTPNPTRRPPSSPIPTAPAPTKAPDNTPDIPDPTPNTPSSSDDPGDSTDVGNKPETSFSITLPFAKKSVITQYSNETPIYSETLNEWACHVALDFSCNEGDNVPVAANGIVTKVTTDDIYGTSVLVSHEDGFYTLYRGLKEAAVKPDELVAKGQSLGTAAESIPFEAHMPTHIHFEVIKDNLSVNPLSFAK